MTALRCSAVKELFDLPLATKALDDASIGPAMLIGAKYSTAQAGRLQLLAQRLVDVPAHSWLTFTATNVDHDEMSKMVALEFFSRSLLNDTTF